MYDRYLQAMDLDRLMDHVHRLNAISPERLSGTEIERRVVDYFREYLATYGVPMTVHELEGFVSFPGHSQLKLRSPHEQEIPCSTFAQIASTAGEGLEAELVYVGQGGLSDYEGRDVEGKVVLTELSYTPPRPEKVRLATENGAKGMVMMNWGLPEHDSLPLGTVKSIWGNPTDQDFHLMPRIPVIGIRRGDGETLMHLCNRGSVRVWMLARAERRWETILLPHITIPGSGESDRFVLVGGHYDCWGAGVTCNAVGNAVKLELARILWENRDQLHHDVWVCFWPAHETGIMEGSVWFVDHFWKELTHRGIVYFNVDSPGLKDASEIWVRTSAEAARFHEQVSEKVVDPSVTIRRLRLTRTGDQSFFGVGVPSIYARHSPSQEEQKRWHGATLGWWYHSSEDTVDKIDRDHFIMDARLITAYVVGMADSRMLPFEFTGVAEEFIDRLKELQAVVEEHLDLSDALERAEVLRKKSEQLDQFINYLKEQELPADDGRVKLMNECQMRLSRTLTPVISTSCGRYGHDTYGLSAQSTPVPVLYDAPRLAEIPPESHEHKLLYTRLVRERNKVWDALDQACCLIDVAMDRAAAG
jgi:hypothetical protein